MFKDAKSLIIFNNPHKWIFAIVYMQIFDFNSNYEFYNSYHGNIINKWIHILCIPAIVWSTMVLLSDYNFYRYNVSTVLLLFYSGYYTILNPVLAVVAVPLLFYCFFNAFAFKWNYPDYKWRALTVFAIAWIFQFIGHCVFEGNAPALTDSILQAFLMAPLFVVQELISIII
tara:strand:- start:37 stop:552 length:516 start_codon:yes stop_codon:yes gene_type:complete